MSFKISKHFLVSGKVQGVFYRDSTCKKAKELHITGWVRNLTDGRVELIACGEPDGIDTLETWLWQGPPAANVKDVKGEIISFKEYTDFVVLHVDPVK